MVDDGSRILAGRYEVGELIGRGGMAEVHIGHDTRLGRTVAIKILRSDLARDPSFLARFRREAQAAAALNHPAIVAVYDTGEDTFTDPTGAVSHVPFIVMEYVEGHTVRDILRDGQAVPIEEAIEITSGVLSALEYSHHAGIVHRDIKPANVMLTPTGAVKVMDFGIARAVADSAATMTQTQAVIGTAQYLSPEQARGETVDARSDLYSAGCLLFELLTGRPPFIGDSPVAVAYQHVREIAPAPSSIASDVPEVLDRICAKALAKERDHRYASAAEFRADLEAAARGGHVAAPALAAAGLAAATQVMSPQTAEATQVMPGTAPAWAPTAIEPTGPDADAEDEEEGKSKKWLWITLSIVGVLAVAGLIWVLLQGNESDQPPQVTIPAVAGEAEADATTELQDLNLEVRRVDEPSATVAAGMVTRTDPAEGTSVDEGSTVSLYVSTGPDSASVPDVTGMSQEQARDQLEAAGFQVGNVTSENSPDQPADRVLRTEPAKGQAVDAGSEITLVVSTGQVDLPNLVGQAQADAQATLSGLKLSAVIQTQETADAEPGTVINQDRAAGPVPQGSTITLTVAAAPTTVTIPDGIVGMSSEEATSALQDLGLTVRTDGAQSETVPEGDVMSVQPSAGSSVPIGSTVTITVSEGAPTSNNSGGGGNGNNAGGN
ncbi:Stk1 family PASTA domain-containing Ser/Thr kinase [Cellulomonas denverensis]|uniref:non-specific serine/threonine protein kinase n=1 Tax=Cellulomonas denverensis TaxID=264297 RepID=A0A7X6KYB7_9CELL|nr:Stk1 family PASTA domain-containing Ser/Thr kinase [Cellulomonas denverensis]NKY24275.1 Stk1 family PASTA domain-containing Ser/Thr kinase [Cellulomonas denverensis]GIG26752.1 protein kinase [Cellulomonas denverensis]